MARIRAFLGINFSVAVTRRIHDEIARRHASVKEAGFRVSWVPAANLHVTVEFLGDIEPELANGIASRLRASLAARRPFELSARGLGAFPAAGTPRVLWVGLGGAVGELNALQAEVRKALESLGWQSPTAQPFRPHITVGRVREGDGALPWSDSVELGSSQISEVVLYESKPATKGVEYAALARIPVGEQGNVTGS
jgi:2'-5' RNA ligase